MYSGTISKDVPIDDIATVKNVKDFVHFIAITSNKAFLFKESHIFPQTGHFTALGTGYKGIIGCYYVVRDVSMAFKLSSEIDTLSSPEYTSIMADSLNLFTME